MRITLSNIGLISELELDTSKDLMVFCGPNNTGKTYASYSLYGINSLFNRPGMLAQQFPMPGGIDKLVSDGVLELDLVGYLSIHLQSILTALSDYAVKRLTDTFATPASHFAQAKLTFVPDLPLVLLRLTSPEITDRLKLGQATTIDVVKEANSGTVKLLLMHQGSAEIPDEKAVSWIIRQWCCATVLQALLHHPFIIPAERMAVQLFARELSASNRSDGYLSPSAGGSLKLMTLGTGAPLSERRYPLPVRDALQISEDMPVLKRYKSPYANMASWLEKAVLKGKLGIGREGEIDYKPAGRKTAMPLHMAASMVKSLAMLVLYLKHIAQPGDLLILDEPELNLHPDNQVQLARLLGKLVNSGIKVMMTSHSDYIIRELNNLVMLGTLDGRAPQLLKKYGYDKGCFLQYTQVGAYMFTEEDQRILPVDEDGFSVPSLDTVTDSLNLSADEIAYHLHRFLPRQ